VMRRRFLEGWATETRSALHLSQGLGDTRGWRCAVGCEVGARHCRSWPPAQVSAPRWQREREEQREPERLREAIEDDLVGDELQPPRGRRRHPPPL